MADDEPADQKWFKIYFKQHKLNEQKEKWSCTKFIWTEWIITKYPKYFTTVGLNQKEEGVVDLETLWVWEAGTGLHHEREEEGEQQEYI